MPVQNGMMAHRHHRVSRPAGCRVSQAPSQPALYAESAGRVLSWPANAEQAPGRTPLTWQSKVGASAGGVLSRPAGGMDSGRLGRHR